MGEENYEEIILKIISDGKVRRVQRIINLSELKRWRVKSVLRNLRKQKKVGLHLNKYWGMVK